jgi:hypothetical protein
MSDLPPTPARRREARARGDVAVSPLFIAAGAFGGAGLSVALAWSRITAALTQLAGASIGVEAPENLPWRAVLWWCLVPALAGALAGALAIGLLQTRALFSFGTLGWRRETPPSTWLGLLLAGGVLVLSLLALRALVAALILAAPRLDAVVGAVTTTVAAYAPRFLLLIAAVGLAELARRRARLERALSMSRAERRAEARSDGPDPRLRAETNRRR